MILIVVKILAAFVFFFFQQSGSVSAAHPVIPDQFWNLFHPVPLVTQFLDAVGNFAHPPIHVGTIFTSLHTEHRS